MTAHLARAVWCPSRQFNLKSIEYCDKKNNATGVFLVCLGVSILYDSLCSIRSPTEGGQLYERR